MQKSNKSIAGYHLLMILSSVDGEFAPAEGMKIQEYLAEEFPFRVNLDNELDVIATLKPEEWKDHFEFHARCFMEDSEENERAKFLDFAKSANFTFKVKVFPSKPLFSIRPNSSRTV